MKIAYLFPTKLVFGEIQTPRKLDCEYPIYVVEKRNYYFCQTDGRQKYHNAECNFYYFEINGNLVYGFCADDDSAALLRLDSLGKDAIDNHVTRMKNILANPEGYFEEQRKVREKIKEERRIADEEYNRQKEERAKKAEEAYRIRISNFKTGGEISWEDFERACKENKINIPIKTIGWGRNSVTKLTNNSYSFRGNKSNKLPELLSLLAETI